jgi:hypothetical protein
VVASVAAVAPLREIEAEIEAGEAATGGAGVGGSGAAAAVGRPAAARQSVTRERAREEAGMGAKRQLTVGVGSVRLLGRAARQRPERVRVEVEVMGVQVRKGEKGGVQGLRGCRPLLRPPQSLG